MSEIEVVYKREGRYKNIFVKYKITNTLTLLDILEKVALHSFWIQKSNLFLQFSKENFCSDMMIILCSYDNYNCWKVLYIYYK